MDDNLADYIREKAKVFRQLCIPLTQEQIDHMATLNSEIAIDNYAHDLIKKRMG